MYRPRACWSAALRAAAVPEFGLPQDVKAWIVDFCESFDRLVGGTVIDHPNLERNVCLLQRGPNRAENEALSLVDGNNHGNESRLGGGGRHRRCQHAH